MKKSSTPEEMSELEEEPDQRWQERQMPCMQRSIKMKLVLIGAALLAIMQSAVLCLFTGAFLPLLLTIVAVPLFYKGMCLYLDKSDASSQN
jgi:hypothetical protein